MRTATATLVLALALAACTTPPDDDATSSRREPTVPLITPTAECVPRDGLPDRRCTPGAVNRRVTQATIATTICRSGWSSSVRPPTSYTTPIKRAMLGTKVVTLHLKGEGGRPVDVTVHPYGPYAGKDPADYELDHLVAIEDGGDPWLVENLWLEADKGGNPKDSLENRLHQAVCSGKVSLDDARQGLAIDWRMAESLLR